MERYEKAKARFDEVTEDIAERSAKGERLAGFIRTIEAQREPVVEFDERLWERGGLCDGGDGHVNFKEIQNQWIDALPDKTIVEDVRNSIQARLNFYDTNFGEAD